MGDERGGDTINNTQTVHEQELQQKQQHEQAKEEDFVADEYEEETFVPHVEVKLPSYSLFEHHQQQQLEDGAQEDVIEFHICVVCTTSSSSSTIMNDSQHNVYSYAADDFVIEDDHDSVSIEEHCHRQSDQQQHVCHGIAKWKLSPSEMIAMSSSQESSTSSSGYDRPRGKVVLLPIHQQIPDNINSDDKQEEEVVKLAMNAMLSVQIERISKPSSTVAATATTMNKREQYHTIESREWRAPASIDSFEGENNDIKKNQSTFGKLVRRATSTLTMMGPGGTSAAVGNTPRPSTSNQSARNTSEANYCNQQPHVQANNDAVKDAAAPAKKQQSKDQMVGKVIEAIIEHRCPSSSNTSSPEQQQGRDMPSFSSSVHIKKPTASSKPTKQQSQSAVAAADASIPITKAPSNNTPPQLKLHERFLCGTSFITDFGNALQILAAAGHHCDEDHVGLYVVNSDEDSNGYSWENL